MTATLEASAQVEAGTYCVVTQTTPARALEDVGVSKESGEIACRGTLNSPPYRFS